MKFSTYLIALLFFLMGIQNVNAQAPSWQWVKTSGGTQEDEARSVCTDSSGNVYVTGNFFDSSITIGSFTLIGTGSPNWFIAKYSPSGNVLWAKAFGGTYWDYIFDLCCDGNGNIYSLGVFKEDTLTLGNISLVNSGNTDVFFAKFDSGGNILWAKSMGGNDIENAASICTNSFGEVAITGGFYSATMAIGSATLIHSPLWQLDFFIAKFDTNGNLLWANGGGDEKEDQGTAVTMDEVGSVYALGIFFSDSIRLGSVLLLNSDVMGGSKDLFIVKYDLSGNTVWAKSAGGMSEDAGQSICTDQNGNIIIGGYYTSDTIRFDSYIFTNVNNWRLFLVKMDDSGNVLWAKEGTDGGFFLNDIDTDAEGNIFITGQIWCWQITFGNITVTMPSSNIADVFIMKFDPLGNAIWGKGVYGVSYDDVYGISIDLNSNIYIAGRYSSDTMSFDAFNLCNTNNYNAFFLAKLFDPTSVGGIHSENAYVESFPNPFSDYLYIEVNSIEKNTAILLDMQGAKIQIWELNSGRNEISMQGFAEGTYILEIISKDGIVNRKIIKPN
jgi:hypothetical protein